MKYTITAPGSIHTRIVLPASKSISNRALVISALADSDILPANLSCCDDTEVMVGALKSPSPLVEGGVPQSPEIIDIGAAGTAMRFLTAYFCVSAGEHVVTGTERMRHRPIGVLVDALRYLGAGVEYVGKEGFPPLLIRGGKLEGGHLEVPGNVSSQYISALLMIGPVLEKGLELHLKGGIASRPYIDLTLCMMKEYGADAEWTDVDTITVRPVPYRQREYQIESDWSASSYWYEIMALIDDRESEVELVGLMDGSRQGDSVARYLSSTLGVKTAFVPRTENTPAMVRLTRHVRTLPRLDYDFVNSPDLAQTYVAACCALGIPFHFTGLASLKIKETDRIEALKTELRKLGFVVRDKAGRELIWDGERCEPTGEPVDTYEDHRMAMAFAPLAIKLGQIEINNPQVVSKSYPAFWDDLRKAGFGVCCSL